MGKKTKDQVPNANSVPNRDIIQRLNFLYQASVYLDALPTASVSNEHLTLDSMITKTKRPRRSVNAKDLSRSYIRSMKIVGQKTTVKIDPTVKRTLCRGCDAVLVPGTTASVRVKPSSSHGHAVAYTCLACKTSRRIPAPPTLHIGPDLTPKDPWTAPGGPVPPVEPVPRASYNKERKKALVLRAPPLFARAVGHVIFRGSERLEDESVSGT